MVRVARDISADFDFVRVDLYNVQGKIYFGEITCTPRSGYGLIPDPAQQKMRDEMWHLDSGNPLLYKPPRSHRIARSAHREHAASISVAVVGRTKAGAT
jgi:hypothetical protein